MCEDDKILIDRTEERSSCTCRGFPYQAVPLFTNCRHCRRPLRLALFVGLFTPHYSRPPLFTNPQVWSRDLLPNSHDMCTPCIYLNCTYRAHDFACYVQQGLYRHSTCIMCTTSAHNVQNVQMYSKVSVSAFVTIVRWQSSLAGITIPPLTTACQWLCWSTWSELKQMIATAWSPFDCLIAMQLIHACVLWADKEIYWQTWECVHWIHIWNENVFNLIVVVFLRMGKRFLGSHTDFNLWNQVGCVRIIWIGQNWNNQSVYASKSKCS